MSKIREILKKLVEKGFFDSPKSHLQIIEKLDSKGFIIKGKKSGMIGRLLAELCQEELLEREGGKRNYKYKKNE